eukprot:16451667-Heterocapsa_arctica.AAC.1
MEQGHENQAWLHPPESWYNGNSIHNQVQEWTGRIDRVSHLLSQIDASYLPSMNTDPPPSLSGRWAPMSASETINLMCLQPLGEPNNQDRKATPPVGSNSTYHDIPVP